VEEQQKPLPLLLLEGSNQLQHKMKNFVGKDQNLLLKMLVGSLVLLSFLTIGLGVALAQVTFFSTGFNTGAPAEFSGITTTEGVQGYEGLGTGDNVFGGDFLRNTSGSNFSGGPAPSKSTLTLTDLPEHTSISLGFLLAIIDSWDGNGCGAPDTSNVDIFNVTVDGGLVFSEVFENSGCGSQTYIPPAGVELARKVQLGFNTDNTFHLDSAYNMGMDTTFNHIPHTSSTLTIEWFASGDGWQGGTDESWAIDNVEVILNDGAVTLLIDIKPGSDPNSINCNNTREIIPVAILSTEDFDATIVDADSVRFGKTGTEAAEVHRDRNGNARRHVEDVNGDGRDDLVFHFRLGDTGFSCDDIPESEDSVELTARLTGEANGTSTEGEDSIRLFGRSE
jgi:hypothetical protein